MRGKNVLLVSLIATYVIVLLRAIPAPGPLFQLEIPEYGLQVEGDGAASLPKPDISHFEIHIQKSGFNYGSIRSKINAEPANIIMSTAAKGTKVVCSFDLRLRSGFSFAPGRNSVEISFEDSRSKVYYSSFLLRGSAPPRYVARHLAPAKDALPADKYAVIVGISKYANRAIESLQYANRDADLFRNFLVSANGGGFKPENIVYLIDEEATSTNIRTAFFNFLTKPREQDLAVIYFAGHGAPDPNDPRQLYLLTHDTDPKNMGGTAFMMENFQDLFLRILKPKRIVTFADACHSKGLSGMLYGDVQKNNLINQYLTRFAADSESQRAIITASDISESSFESDQWGGGHGVFTHFLVEGLKGEADLNRDGTVLAGELFQYVQSKVRQATSGSQNPSAVAGLSEDLPLSGFALRRAHFKYLPTHFQSSLLHLP